MGAVPSTPRGGNSSRPQETAEYLIGTFVGAKSFPLASEFWQNLLELPLNLHWSPDRVREACEAFAQKNYQTRHLAKILIHLGCSLQDCTSSAGAPSPVYNKAVNAAHTSSIFLKYLIENAKTDNFEELCISLEEKEGLPSGFSKDQSVEHFVMHSVLHFIGTVDVSPTTYLLHYELLSFIIVAMSTKLLSRSSPGPIDVHPFIDAIMDQDADLVALVMRRLLLNYIFQPHSPFSSPSYAVFTEGSEPGVLERVGSAAASFVLMPLNLLIGSNTEGSRNLLAESILHLLLILINYRKCIPTEEPVYTNEDDANSDTPLKENTHFAVNPYCKALESVRDVEFDRLDIEANAHDGPLVRMPFASLYDTLGMRLTDESAVLLLYSLLHGTPDFLEYVLVRTDLDTLLMPILETLYDASRRTPNQMYMSLIILLILSQDSTFNASVHKLILPHVPWYQERRLHQISLGSLMVIVLIRTVKYNLSRMRDVYLHTNCLATVANMAPHAHRLGAYASQRLVSLFYMLSRKYTKLAELQNDKMHPEKGNSIIGDVAREDVSMELHIYTDFLRIVLEIINAILTYALPRNPEVVYAIMHRQEVFQPFKSHPRFIELLENIFTVLDFFNSRMDAQVSEGEWSVEKVLEVIINNCRSWRGDGMKMFTQLRFTYEQESHPEEFFIPYVWQLALYKGGFAFDPSKIRLFSIDLPKSYQAGEETKAHESSELGAEDQA